VNVWQVLISLAGGLILLWATMLFALYAGFRGERDRLREALLLLPVVLRLLRRLAADPDLPRGVRWRLSAVVVYLVLPIDLVPDFIPVLGYADDAIIVTAVLRGVVRRAGIAAVRAHWPGTDDGFAALVRLTGIGAATRTD
jgi:uncharacterized membrane protein YkvA (DUF1232 family)